jgi:hypothetical protein
MVAGGSLARVEGGHDVQKRRQQDQDSAQGADGQQGTEEEVGVLGLATTRIHTWSS